MARALEFEEMEHLIKIIDQLKAPEDKGVILNLICEYSAAFGEIEGMLCMLKPKEKP